MYRFTRIQHTSMEYADGEILPVLNGVIEHQLADGSFKEVGVFTFSIVNDAKPRLCFEGRID